MTRELGLFVNGPRAFTSYFPWVLRDEIFQRPRDFKSSRNVIRPPSKPWSNVIKISAVHHDLGFSFGKVPPKALNNFKRN